MYFLNTTRHLTDPATDATIERLLERLTGTMSGSLQSSGIRSNAWLMSADRMTFQAFTGFDDADADADAPARAEANPAHLDNSAAINALLGGLAESQQHTHYRLLLSRRLS